MKQINNYIIERLRINKDTYFHIDDYEEKYGPGKLMSFKDCDIYKVERHGMKNLRQEYKDRSGELNNIIDKYFKDNDQVWEVEELFKKNSKVTMQLNKEISKDIVSNSKPLLQKVDTHYYQQGYFLKELPDKSIVLIIKYFRASGQIWKIKYIFKL